MSLPSPPHPLPLRFPATATTHRWFARDCCVVTNGDEREVYVCGTLIGKFAKADRAARNAVLMALCLEPRMHLGQLTDAFEMSPEALRQMRRQYEVEGLAPVLERTPGGSESKVSPAQHTRIEKMFAKGMSVREVAAKMKGISRGPIGRIRREWGARTAQTRGPVAPKEDVAPAAGEQRSFASDALPTPSEPAPAHDPETIESTLTGAPEAQATAVAGSPHDSPSAVTIVAGSEVEARGADVVIASTSIEGGRHVQHVGAWLLVAMVSSLGLHRRADALAEGRVTSSALRIALDALTIALAIGERCVEGVRRIATATAGILLHADHAPSATWVRRVLGRFAMDLGAVRLHFGMARTYLDARREDADDAAVVFYIDNHMRPYTGSAVLRKGWRMQDKRARPGSTDYYVHDDSGRPVLRIDVPSHSSLTEWLCPIGGLLREALGPDVKIILAFDRAGAYAEQLAELRDTDFEFVTYERRPYPTLSGPTFEDVIKDGDESIGVFEKRTNLGDGKGRVRRIALRFPAQGKGARQVNLLATSTLSCEELYWIMRGRWSQENGFKHSVERWGINQLDGRTTERYDPDTIIPNPARRRLDRALKIARAREGKARRELAHLPPESARRAKWDLELEEALAQQDDLKALRPQMPTHAPLAETELADTLVKHEQNYKVVIDTVRIACANAESALAMVLGEHLKRPQEAKRALANLFAAPGDVRVGERSIVVTLRPAATRDERIAFTALLREAESWKLTLPGDPRACPVRFRIASDA